MWLLGARKKKKRRHLVDQTAGLLFRQASGISLYRIAPQFFVRVGGRAGGLEAILVLAKTHDKAWLAFSQALRYDGVGGPAESRPPIQMGDERISGSLNSPVQTIEGRLSIAEVSY